ncbi:MAG: SRPBCC domain-containing protein [Betaproteobacteria bacterium]
MNTPDTETDTVVVERRVPHPPEKVWRALTQGPLLQEWLMANDFQPVVGHRFNFRMQAMAGWNGVTDCEVLTVVPNEELSYTWNASGDEAATGLRTVVTWTLEPFAGGVLVRMAQSGFRPQDRRNFMGAKYGWERNLGELERVVAGLS